MCAKTYNSDSEHYVCFDDLEEPIPLCFNTIYYVETPDNEELNNLVQQFFLQDPNALLPRDLRRLRYRFRYLSQKELQPDKLYKRLAEQGVDDNDPTTAEAIDFLRECLHTDTGGYLVARQLPKISEKNGTIVLDKEEHMLSYPLLHVANTKQSIQDFLYRLANSDFESLSGVSYGRYYRDKYERRELRGSCSPRTMSISFIQVPLNISEIDEDTDRKAKEFNNQTNDFLPEDEIKAILIAQRALDLRKNKLKINQLCAISVDKQGKIYYKIDGKEVECKFVRGPLGRALYILYLRQIERAAKDLTGKTPSSICRNHLNKYEDELFEIYTSMKPSGIYLEKRKSIENLWRNPTNDISKINKFFEETFNVEAIAPKYYTIEVVGYDENGDKLEAVGLETEDFDLGDFSIDKLRVYDDL